MDEQTFKTLLQDLLEIYCGKRDLSASINPDYGILAKRTYFSDRTLKNWFEGKNSPTRKNLNVLSYHVLVGWKEKGKIFINEDVAQLLVEIEENEILEYDFFHIYKHILSENQQGLKNQPSTTTPINSKQSTLKEKIRTSALYLIIFVLGGSCIYLLPNSKANHQLNSSSNLYKNSDLYEYIQNEHSKIEEIWVSGGHLQLTVGENLNAFQSMLSEGKILKFIFISPESPAIKYASLRYPIKRDTSRFISHIVATNSRLNHLLENYSKDQLDVQTIDYNLDERIIIINPKKDDSKVYVKIYPYKSDGGVDYGGLYLYYSKLEHQTEYEFYFNKYLKYMEDAIL